MSDKLGSIVPGNEDAKIEGRSLLYQLILVQFVYDRQESLDGIAHSLNQHPLLQFEAASDDAGVARLYQSLLAKYEVPEEGKARKRGVSRQVEALAEVLYAQYMRDLHSQISADKQDFDKLFSQIKKDAGAGP